MFERLPYFNPFVISNPTLPKMYWEVKSPEQLIANLYCIINALKDYVNESTNATNGNTERIENLEALFAKFIDSGFDEYYKAQIEQWINDNAILIWKAFAQMVFFGLTEDGRFCAYVPESWSDITFDTGVVYGSEQYGRLILRYRANGEGVIDNTHPLYPSERLDARVSELENKMNRVQNTLYTALHNMEVLNDRK